MDDMGISGSQLTQIPNEFNELRNHEKITANVPDLGASTWLTTAKKVASYAISVVIAGTLISICCYSVVRPWWNVNNIYPSPVVLNATHVSELVGNTTSLAITGGNGLIKVALGDHNYLPVTSVVCGEYFFLNLSDWQHFISAATIRIPVAAAAGGIVGTIAAGAATVGAAGEAAVSAAAVAGAEKIARKAVGVAGDAVEVTAGAQYRVEAAAELAKNARTAVKEAAEIANDVAEPKSFIALRARAEARAAEARAAEARAAEARAAEARAAEARAAEARAAAARAAAAAANAAADEVAVVANAVVKAMRLVEGAANSIAGAETYLTASLKAGATAYSTVAGATEASATAVGGTTAEKRALLVGMLWAILGGTVGGMVGGGSEAVARTILGRVKVVSRVAAGVIGAVVGKIVGHSIGRRAGGVGGVIGSVGGVIGGAIGGEVGGILWGETPEL